MKVKLIENIVDNKWEVVTWHNMYVIHSSDTEEEAYNWLLATKFKKCIKMAVFNVRGKLKYILVKSRKVDLKKRIIKIKNALLPKDVLDYIAASHKFKKSFRFLSIFIPKR